MEKDEFIFFLKRQSAKISNGTSYQELSDSVREIRNECVAYFKMTWDEFNTGITRDLRLSERILERYRHKASVKSNNSVFEEFRKEYCYDIDKLIFRLDYN